MDSNHQRQGVPDDLPRENPLKLFTACMAESSAASMRIEAKNAPLLWIAE